MRRPDFLLSGLIYLSGSVQPTLVQAISAITPYSLPISLLNEKARSTAIQIKRDAFVYGTSIAGNTSYWPAGSLGNAITTRDFALFSAAALPQETSMGVDYLAALSSVTLKGGINHLTDYLSLYEDQWKLTIPRGVDSGILTNYTQDLLFSMERLTFNPFSIRRLNPQSDSLAFQLDDATSAKVSSTTLQSLFETGNLFYADHRYQQTLAKPDIDRYAAACDAYFYIHPTSGDFLPLAIQTNVGDNLIYTPVDSANDWLLAKMMFNQNDFWHSQWYHLAATHNVIEIVYEAAFRTLSDDHPIMGLLQRLSPQLFAYRQKAIASLVNKGGFVDQVFAFTGDAAAQTTSDLYNSGIAGSFQGNYFHSSLQTRGLSNSTYGPDLKHFPFLEDASVVHAAIKQFMTTFVEAYYTDPSIFEEDKELQAWIAEASPAKIMDFPTTVDRTILIDILTHIAYLGSALHQTLNTNDLSEGSGILPFTPFSFYKQLPSSKGVEDLVPFLPNVTQSLTQVLLTAAFARPQYVNSKLSLTEMFNDPAMLLRMKPEVAVAANKFKNAMKAFSKVVSSRKFDAAGLCQGMPFIWKALDPERAPYFLTI